MKNSLNKRSLDNVTVVIIAFSGFREAVTALKSQHKLKDTSAKIFKGEKPSKGIPSKSQRSSSQNQILGRSKGFISHNTLM